MYDYSTVTKQNEIIQKQEEINQNIINLTNLYNETIYIVIFACFIAILKDFVYRILGGKK